MTRQAAGAVMGSTSAGAGDAIAAAPASARRFDGVFLLILLAALGLRVHLAATAPYIHDEANTAIPLSRAISFDPADLRLPLRGENHGALPAYVVKTSGLIFGTSPLGYRLLHVILGLCTIVLVYRMTAHWAGPPAARWAAALFAFNDYYLGISARATAHAPHLFLVVAAIYAFSRFLAARRAGYLYAAGISLGLAFYCKEHSALLVPVFFVTLLHPRYRSSLRTPHAYLACAIFALMIVPDIAWNLTTNRETARVPYDETVGHSTYRSHLERIGGLGFSPYPSMFYARDAVMPLHLAVTGRELRDETPEYRSMNPVLGLLLLGAVVMTTVRPFRREAPRGFLLLVFWAIFGFFTLIRPGNPPGRLDPVSWVWVEVTMIPAVVFAGVRLADARGRSRLLTWAIAAGALAYAVAVAWSAE